MKKLFSLAVIGLAARWLLDSVHGAERRAMLLDGLRGITGRMPHASDAMQGARDVAERASATATDAAGDLADRATSTARRAADTALGRDTDAATADAANLAGSPDDARLTSKVESELFRGDAVPKGSINVNVEFGKVVLRGEVQSRGLIDDLVARTRSIDGVNDVESLLHVPGEPAPMHE